MYKSKTVKNMVGHTTNLKITVSVRVVSHQKERLQKGVLLVRDRNDRPAHGESTAFPIGRQGMVAEMVSRRVPCPSGLPDPTSPLLSRGICDTRRLVSENGN